MMIRGKQNKRPSVRTAGVSLAALAMGLAAAPVARAQSMDYGAFEQMFGEPVTMSATGKPQKVSEVPVNMDILTQDDIRRSGADNLPDLLQFVPGLNFRRSSFNDGEISVRGYDQPWNPRLLVLVDGRPVYEDFYGDVVWSAIPVQLDEIRQVEVVKGPNSALFGFNAASGVINIVTYDPLADDTNVVTARTGTQNLAELSVVTTLHLSKDAGIRFSLGGTRADEFGSHGMTPTENTTDLLHPQDGTVNIDARWRLTPLVTLSLQASAAEVQRNFPGDETPEQDRTNDIRARVTADTDLGQVDLDAYRSTWRIDYLGSQAQQATNVATDVRLGDLFKVGADNSFRLSLEYKDNRAQGQFFNNSTIFYSVYSAGGMWDRQILSNLDFTNSVRVDYMVLGVNGPINANTGYTAHDYNSSTLTAVSFNSGLVYSPTDVDVFRLMASRGYQLPSLDDLGQQITEPGNTVLTGDPHLNPTGVLNFEADYDHTLAALHTTVRTAVFYQRNTDLFGYDAAGPFTLGPNTLYKSANIGGSDEVGFELGLKGKQALGPGDFRWDLGYAYAQITDHISPAIGAGVYTTYAGATPRHTVDFGLGYSVDAWEFDLKGRWQTRFADFRFYQGAYTPVTVPAYATVNARVGYQLTRGVTVAVTGEQFNQSYILQRASLPVERRAIVSVSVHY